MVLGIRGGLAFPTPRVAMTLANRSARFRRNPDEFPPRVLPTENLGDPPVAEERLPGEGILGDRPNVQLPHAGRGVRRAGYILFRDGRLGEGVSAFLSLPVSPFGGVRTHGPRAHAALWSLCSQRLRAV